MTPPAPFTRPDAIASLSSSNADVFDVLVIGGGATGLGIAVDAATRGFRTALAEAGDFAQATSSRATKLVHGGVRYLASGQVNLVYEALHERAIMMRNAPHLVHPQAFLLPTYTRWELPYFGAGLLLYDVMSVRSSMGRTRILGRESALKQIPNLAGDRLSGGVLYYDGQFNDARFALILARTAVDRGATVLNYMRCIRFTSTNSRLDGAVLRDALTGSEHHVRARVVINATGIFTDSVRQLDDPAVPPLLTVSRGTHIVVGAHVLGGDTGIMVPKTRDGRVIFAIPWQGRVVIGTTDVAAPAPAMEPGHTPSEIAFLLETINPFLAAPLDESDILSVFSGLRPLVAGKIPTTSRISREHQLDISASGLITVAGGKWTTYRHMAEDTLAVASKHRLLEKRPCVTARTPLHGFAPQLEVADPYQREYGADAQQIDALIAAEPTLAEPIDGALPYTLAQCLYAVQQEMAQTLEDVLSRRTRALLLDAGATLRAAPRVAALIASELGHDAGWVAAQLKEFNALVGAGYRLSE